LIYDISDICVVFPHQRQISLILKKIAKPNSPIAVFNFTGISAIREALKQVCDFKIESQWK
jgi:hypothetical protein